VACLQLAARRRAAGQRGSIVGLLCDRGKRYAQSLFDPDWLAARGLDHERAIAELRRRIG
jgi:cysteine synthase A